MKKLNRTFIMTLVAVMAIALGCGKKKEEEKTPAKVPDKGADEARKPAEPARPSSISPGPWSSSRTTMKPTTASAWPMR